MSPFSQPQKELLHNGFAIVEEVYAAGEVAALVAAIEAADSSKPTFRKTGDLFAIRQFLKEVPATVDLIFTDAMKNLISEICGNDYFVVKSIYFDKPPASNWYVPYHQDLTIAVDKKTQVEGYSSWTTKQQHFAVQPPTEVLQNIFTLRIHLDDTDAGNGALCVIPSSHLKGMCRPETIDRNAQKEVTCAVKQVGIMLMKPLTLHRSGRTTNEKRRRVLHLEFSNCTLPAGLHWAEHMPVAF